MESNEKKGMNPMVLGLLAIVVVAVIALGAMSMRGQQTNENAGMPSPTRMAETVTDTGNETMQEDESVYADGIYEVVGAYTSPAGPEELGVTVTVANNLISDVEVEVKATNAVSKKMQTDFADNYKVQVVGKSLDEVNLTKVSGSSLTPKGFNDALQKIKIEAAS